MDGRTGMRKVSVAMLIVLAMVAVAFVNLQALVITLIVAMGIAFALVTTQESVQPVRVFAEEPSTHPEDPRAARSII